VWRVLLYNSTLHEIAHLPVTNLIRTFPSEGRTADTSPLQFTSGTLYNIVLPFPLDTYNTHI
jgi:hypothetical protein